MTSGWTISLRKRIDKPFSVRALVLAAVACGALAGPGVARAASSPAGMADLTTTINDAFTQVEAVAPGATAAAQPAVQQALGAVSAASELAGPQTSAPPATESAPTAPPPAPAAAPSPGELVTNAVAPALAAAGVPPPATWPAQKPPAQETKTVPRRVEAAAARPRAAHSPGTPGTYPQTVPGMGAAPSVAVLTTPRAPTGVSSSTHRSQGAPARSSGTAPAGAHPPRPVPPLPPGPAPGLSSPIQAGGPGSFAPLLVAALAAALALASFPFTSRLLPQLAFRRPRRVVLAVWHPG
jgi:hypothetical protein